VPGIEGTRHNNTDNPNRMKVRHFALALSAALVLSGCSTIVSKTTDGFGENYSGVAHAICINRFVLNAFSGYGFIANIAVLPFSVLNIGLSAVTDTLVLPVDLIAEADEHPPGDCGPERRNIDTTTRK
jgi:uncharacterized protein YceK